jgi:peptidoglycan/LPS O-acetylase OafA/YrhL
VLPALPQSRLFAALSYGGAILALALCGVFYDLGNACPSLMALVPCVATMLIIMQPQAVSRWLVEPLSPVGVISYSLYLWHWPAIVLAAYLLPSPADNVTMGLVLGGATLVAVLSYVGVERPMLDYENRATPRAARYGVIILIALCVITAMALAGLSAVSRVH